MYPQCVPLPAGSFRQNLTLQRLAAMVVSFHGPLYDVSCELEPALIGLPEGAILLLCYSTRDCPYTSMDYKILVNNRDTGSVITVGFKLGHRTD